MTSPARTLPAVTSLYRGLLREVNKQVTRKNNNPFWLHYLRQEFRTPHPASSVPSRIQNAENALLFMKSNRTHRELLEFYFPPMSEDERIKRTVARVGLQLPRMFDPDGEIARDSAAQKV
ncbi:hypothetical protein BCR44DRAFT_1425247 [Catenaria anguillulae PL171]|uniref:Complex 1 LYR protein n=1 Tax=Catenaria anguillulae PL171 TaxID=765915 RepID=A0A1Y2I0Z9_9FUNG|nr:hypothetical protein BCR44DRAFT_1425247 [Catenaria anguillulae PL171]